VKDNIDITFNISTVATY